MLLPSERRPPGTGNTSGVTEFITSSFITRVAHVETFPFLLNTFLRVFNVSAAILDTRASELSSGQLTTNPTSFKRNRDPVSSRPRLRVIMPILDVNMSEILIYKLVLEDTAGILKRC